MEHIEDLPEPEVLFQKAVEDFWQQLLPQDQEVLGKFQSKESMLQKLRSICAEHRNDSSLFSSLTKIAKFANAFAPYFDIINIFVQMKPEYMGAIWGPIRLIFQLGANHTSFLAKVSEMFEGLSYCLPQWQEHFKACRTRNLADESQKRLVSLLGLIYGDVVSFCGELYLIFCRRSKGDKLRYPLRVIKHTVWRPFDVRFEELKSRLLRHQQLFEQEMELHDQEMLTQLFNDFQLSMKTSADAGGTEEARRRAEQKRAADDKVDSILRWIWNVDHRTIYEHAAAEIHPCSCDWFFERPEYLGWRDKPFESRSSSPSDLAAGKIKAEFLCLQAKPGFGKTTLSTAIIDNIAGFHALQTKDTALRPFAAFVHFSANDRRGVKTSTSAFRALAAQLINFHCNQDSVKDALLILFDQLSGEQQHASHQQTVAVLRLLVQQWPTAFVLDGVDECEDETRLLANIWGSLHDLDCRVLFLGRPNVNFPSLYRALPGGWQIQLHNISNTPGIRAFLERQLLLMANENLLPNVDIGDALLDDLATRSDGMFLWAKLLVNYLESPALSPRQRLEVLQQASLLEGLRNLYRQILMSLQKHHSQQAKLASSLFKYIAHSLYPLSIEELHIALAIEPGRPTSGMDLLANFPHCLRQITCALVDVDLDRGINFIHVSFREYLVEDTACPPLFSLCEQSATHDFLVTRCLSYLLHDIPDTPLRRLERDPGTETLPRMDMGCGFESRFESKLTPAQSRELVQSKYPFLKYGALCWISHLSDCLRLSPPKAPVDSEPRSLAMSVDSSPYARMSDRYRSNTDSPRKRRRLHIPHDPEDEDVEISWSTRDSEDSGIYYGESPRLSSAVPSHQRAHIPGSRAPSLGWMTLLAQFLVRRLNVTAWVEACETFAFSPSFDSIVEHFSRLRDQCSTNTVEGREMWWIAIGATQLAGALDDLRKKHGSRLRQNPTLIWQEQIQAAEDAKFWPCWKVSWENPLEAYSGEEETQADFRPYRDVPPANFGGMTMVT